MIVKNEVHVLEKTLNCLFKYINFDYYVICDTGSTDGTQDLIKNYFNSKGVRGEIHQREWKNFGFNRSEAFSFAEGRSDYVFVFDADDYIYGEVDFPDELDKDFYLFKFGPDFIYYRPLLFKNNLSWSFKCVLHEYAYSPLASSSEEVSGDYFFESGRSGDRNKNQKEKKEKDIKTLEDAVKEEPQNERYWFYLAQTYKDSGLNEQAVEAYNKRISLCGWDQETFFALYQKAECLRNSNSKWEDVKNAYLDSFKFRPNRIEGLYEIGKALRLTKNFQEAVLFLKTASQNRRTEDTLFVSQNIYEWQALDEYSICASICGFNEEALNASCEILEKREYPESQRDRLEENRMFGLNLVRNERQVYPQSQIDFLKLEFEPLVEYV